MCLSSIHFSPFSFPPCSRKSPLFVLVMLRPHEAWLLVSTISRISRAPPCAMESLPFHHHKPFHWLEYITGDLWVPLPNVWTYLWSLEGVFWPPFCAPLFFCLTFSHFHFSLTLLIAFFPHSLFPPHMNRSSSPFYVPHDVYLSDYVWFIHWTFLLAVSCHLLFTDTILSLHFSHDIPSLPQLNLVYSWWMISFNWLLIWLLSISY